MKKLKEMKKNNKGFSLVELIIVIAIMAVLMAVLAPQFLRYIERSRLQSDNTAIGEIANACKIACANEDVSSEVAAIAAGIDVAVPVGAANASTVTVPNTVPALQAELNATVGNQVALTSNTYVTDAAGGTTLNMIHVQVTGGVVEVTSTRYVDEVDGTPDNRTF